MTKSEQYNMMLLMSSVSLATVSRMLSINGSTLMDFTQGVMTGIAMVGMIAGLWMYGKARKSKA
ncbi:hypothetical protein [Paenibacillus sp. B2(2019)]|uniref:hypothetical protein n=1 Tax=Paenibacillus sp. B2(2019) TaxID=2607754 RepID=UPI0011F2805F|nr:hypothetical protein [Paenibacillus sp. B2(2019)]KAA1190270.1 hypothetical protein PAENI_05765 [Paenibacillus sp. B2(2019)]